MNNTSSYRLDKLHERIEKNKKELQQLENQHKRIAQSQNQMERKIRTRRLIERGAIVESLLPNSEMLTNDQLKFILEVALSASAVREALAATQSRSARG